MSAVTARRRRQPLTESQQAEAADYRERVARPEWHCPHGIAAGNLVRPWCRTPACPLCRKAGYSRWLWLDNVDSVPAAWR